MLKLFYPITLALLFGFLGGYLANLVNITGAWLVGSMAAVFVAGILKFNIFLPKSLRSVALGFAGMTIGASLNKDSLQLLSILPETLLYMFIFLIILY